jgi:hypothetical protein
MESIDIGGCPSEEQCAQVGPDINYDGQALNRLECAAYIQALKNKFGNPPDDSRFVIHGNPHDFGTYYEVRFRFDPDNSDHASYAELVANGLAHWNEGNCWAPAVYDDKGQPLAIISNPKLWDMRTNPLRLYTLDEEKSAE